MSESVKFNGDLNEVTAALGEWPWTANLANEFWLFDEKQGQNVPLKPGQYVVKIGDRFEVSDKKPRESTSTTTRKSTEEADK